MRKIFKLLALTLVFVMLVGVLASCEHKLSGTYKSETGAEYTFEGDEFTYISTSGQILTGTFEIEQQDEDYRIYLTVKKSGKGMTNLSPVSEPYVIGGEDVGLEYRFKDLNGNVFEDGHIRIGGSGNNGSNFYLVE